MTIPQIFHLNSLWDLSWELPDMHMLVAKQQINYLILQSRETRTFLF